mmetsp:Transcript_10613/g.19597  ORF Transcript_10613/g.19597 Transcript_10613/m.19597 type:complete len:828 (-) Transcript_10613:18-2501(-)
MLGSHDLRKFHHGWPLPLAALVVALVAVTIRLRALAPSGEDLAHVGNLFFSVLETDVVTFAVPAAYFRWVVPARSNEPFGARAAHSLGAGAVAFFNFRLREDGLVEDFACFCSFMVASYIFMANSLVGIARAMLLASGGATVLWLAMKLQYMVLLAKLLLGLCTARLMDLLAGKLRAEEYVQDWNSTARWVFLAVCILIGTLLIPFPAMYVARYLLPVNELSEAYGMIGEFVGPEKLDKLSVALLIITVNCQVSLGYLGIAYLKQGQSRKNALVFISGAGEAPPRPGAARSFAKTVFLYMTTQALPYMLQRVALENINTYAYGRFARKLELSVRLQSVFPSGVAGRPGDTLLAAVLGSRHTTEAYTDSYNSMVGLIFGTIERKLFSVPKLLLLPGMLVQQPWLVVSVVPASVGLEMFRAHTMAALTKSIEKFAREITELAQRRRKIEQHDTKNEELIRRSGLSDFAEQQWRHLAGEIERKTLKYTALGSLRGFINSLYRQDVLSPCYELVIAFLLESQAIRSADIWVYLRAIEDSIDFALTRPRMDASLATLRTNMDRIKDFSTRLERTRSRLRASCKVEPEAKEVRVSDLHYTRGSSLEVRLPELVLRTGRTYAVTGANGCGKSSLFGIIASCGRHGTMLPEGLQIQSAGQLTLPSTDVVEITQHLYCPLFTAPIEWILEHRSLNDTMPADEVQHQERRIEELSRELEFHNSDSQAAAGISNEELHAEVDDWYSTLSGGQRGKVEFMRKVFLRATCPEILIIDEAFAPLDPRSKMLVQQKLKDFCKSSLTLVIYHSDASEKCVSGGDFFDENLHFGNGTASLIPVC